MLRIAHIINPVTAAESSDLRVAQPVTFETMRMARDFARDAVRVDQIAVSYPEDRGQVPGWFITVPDLNRSVTDVEAFRKQRKLPLIGDILDRLYEAAPADYMIYTNVDIALMPHFYVSVKAIIEAGYDAFIINRRTISGRYRSLKEIPLMYAELGDSHKGWDCFVFKRSLYPGFSLGNACIGSGWIGRVMITNLACLGRNFKIFEDLHLTFHIGNEKSWKDETLSDYLRHNMEECRRILLEFDRKNGPLDRDGLPGRFFHLLDRYNGDR